MNEQEKLINKALNDQYDRARGMGKYRLEHLENMKKELKEKGMMNIFLDNVLFGIFKNRRR